MRQSCSLRRRAAMADYIAETETGPAKHYETDKQEQHCPGAKGQLRVATGFPSLQIFLVVKYSAHSQISRLGLLGDRPVGQSELLYQRHHFDGQRENNGRVLFRADLG